MLVICPIDSVIPGQRILDSCAQEMIFASRLCKLYLLKYCIILSPPPITTALICSPFEWRPIILFIPMTVASHSSNSPIADGNSVGRIIDFVESESRREVFVCLNGARKTTSLSTSVKPGNWLLTLEEKGQGSTNLSLSIGGEESQQLQFPGCVYL